ncbi:MAG: hypothetical protein ABW049_09430 [Spongiibacteraceae bacterium]
MSKKSPDSTPSAPPAATTETTSPVTTADTIRAVLRNKTNGGAARSGSSPYGVDQKPPRPPHGTRRSMGKR